MLGFIARLFGNSSNRTINKLTPHLKAIHAQEDSLQTLDDTQLRKATLALQAQLQQTLSPYQKQVDTWQARAKTLPDLKEKVGAFEEAKKAEARYLQALEEALDSALPRAFAIVRETARRLKEHQGLVVQATDYDRALAAKHDYVVIKGEEAHWLHSWEAAGQRITWDMVHYDVQLLGGIVLHQGKIAEMATGEGKTLAATLPTFLNALAGRGVHIVTVNNYLTRRDAAWMAPLYQFHGLTVACADNHPPQSVGRKQAYAADITYITNHGLGFDYLRDNMVTDVQHKVQRSFHYGLFDEVDSVMIDDARTPMIMSGPATYDNSQYYYDLKPRVYQLYRAQYTLITKLLQEAKHLITKGKEGDKQALEEGQQALFRVYRGLPKHGPLISYLSEPGIKQLLAETEDYYLQEKGRFMPEADAPLYFTIDARTHTIELTDLGIDILTKQGEEEGFFLLPDMATETGAIERDPALTDEARIAGLRTLQEHFNTKATRIHTVQQLLKAYGLFEKNVAYVVIKQQVKIVDSKTGRLLEGRRYSKGLHQAIEAKENVPIQRPTQTNASITIQNLIRMYHKPAGMTGTAETDAMELWDTYKMEVVVVPTNKPLARQDMEDKIYKTKHEKDQAIKEEVATHVKEGRPVLVGTASVEESDHFRKVLKLAPHQVLNATNHQRESEIVAKAGTPGRVTIVTQMGGRGTDIKLTPEAKAAGGLAIIGTERHESRRVDRQLRGRAGRQGDPGSSQFFISLEDTLMAHYRHHVIGKQLDKRLVTPGEAIQDTLITQMTSKAQQAKEQQHFASRKQSLAYDDVMNVQRKVIYSKRNHALLGEWITLDILRMLHDHATTLITTAQQTRDHHTLDLALKACIDQGLAITEDNLLYQSSKALIAKVYQALHTTYTATQQQRTQQVTPLLVEAKANPAVGAIILPWAHGKDQVAVPFLIDRIDPQDATALHRAFEGTTIRHFIDRYWQEHLQHMDELREDVRYAVYEQKDPLLMYKFESLKLFKQLHKTLNQQILTFLCRALLVPKQAHIQPRPTTTKPQAAPTAKQEPPTSHDPNHPMGRNQRVSVRYADGTTKRDVKYKTVAQDLAAKQCVLITADSSKEHAHL